VILAWNDPAWSRPGWSAVITVRCSLAKKWQQVIDYMIVPLGDHAIYPELLVGVAGFEPAAS
jgi:hypothetical protein